MERQNLGLENEINIVELLEAIWRFKKLILFVFVIGTSAAVFIALNKPNIYQSTAVLTPKGNEQSNGVGNFVGQLGGLASIAGISIPQTSSKTSYALAILKSPDFIGTFIKYENLTPLIMGASGWDFVENKPIFDEDIYDASNQAWVREVSFPMKPEPSFQEAANFFINEFMSVSRDDESGLVYVSIKYFSPSVAQEWNKKLIAAVDAFVRDQDMRKAGENTEFIREQIQASTITEVRRSLFELLEQQTKQKMLSNASQTYVFDIIQRPSFPEVKSEPRRAFIVAFGAAISLFLAFFVIATTLFFENIKRKE